jgi:RimJ/RimL family protein N-acetyltransferase
MKGLLLDQDQLVMAWARKTFRLWPQPVDKAIGIIGGGGNLVGVCFFQGFNSVNVDLSYYGPNTLTSGIVKFIAQTVAEEFKAARLTVVTSQRNRRLIKSLLKIGFKIEGVQRRFYGHHDNKRNTAVRLVVFRERIDEVINKFTMKERNAF